MKRNARRMDRARKGLARMPGYLLVGVDYCGVAVDHPGNIFGPAAGQRAAL